MLPLLSLLATGCGRPTALIDCEALSSVDPEGAALYGSNVLMIVSDDIGIDKTGVYDAHPSPARTPNIDQLACAGVVFNNAYSNPVCSSSRAAIMTGRHGSRTGIGRWIHAGTATFDLRLDEVTLPEMLSTSDHGYTSSAVGKWHLVGFERGTDPALHPNDQGFSYYAGALGNPNVAIQSGNQPRGYENWEKVTNGSLEWVTTYMSTDTANEAVEQIQTLPEPWFLYVAFNGAHQPVHVPPRDLITTATTGLSSDLKKYNAMVEATDAEIGRVIASIPPDVLARTTIIYTSDNGTQRYAIEEPWNRLRGKGSLFEGGVNVPMIVTGPFVSQPGSTADALVHFVDLFPTIAEMAEVPLGDSEGGLGLTLDGVSFLEVLDDPDAVGSREAVFSEKFYPNGDPADASYHHRMVTDGSWKLIQKDEDGVEESLYRLEGWMDGDNLIDAGDEEAMAAYERLSAVLEEHIERLSSEW